MRRWLIYFLMASAFVQSFDALLHRALASGVVSVWWLAALWALTIDGWMAAGMLGVRADRSDRLAWLMTVLSFAVSTLFQIATPAPWMVRAVPPVALFLALVVLDFGRRETAEPSHAETRETPVSSSRVEPPAATHTPPLTVAQARMHRALVAWPPGERPTAGALSQAAQVSRATAGRWLKEHPPYEPAETVGVSNSNGSGG